MIRKLRTQRDNQQWMLDLALNMRGRVQNFERDDLEVPAGKRARNYRMLPKVWREAAARHEALARRAHAQGFNEVATRVWELVEAPRSVHDVVRVIVDEYDVDASTCEDDVVRFLTKLRDEGLVEVATAR